MLQKANGAVSKTEAVEDMLRAALKCDELGARVLRPAPPFPPCRRGAAILTAAAAQVHKLRVAVEDEGTRGDGDNIPGSFKKVHARRITSSLPRRRAVARFPPPRAPSARLHAL